MKNNEKQFEQHIVPQRYMPLDGSVFGKDINDTPNNFESRQDYMNICPSFFDYYEDAFHVHCIYGEIVHCDVIHLKREPLTIVERIVLSSKISFQLATQRPFVILQKETNNYFRGHFFGYKDRCFWQDSYSYYGKFLRLASGFNMIENEINESDFSLNGTFFQHGGVIQIEHQVGRETFDIFKQ